MLGHEHWCSTRNHIVTLPVHTTSWVTMLRITEPWGRPTLVTHRHTHSHTNEFVNRWGSSKAWVKCKGRMAYPDELLSSVLWCAREDEECSQSQIDPPRFSTTLLGQSFVPVAILLHKQVWPPLCPILFYSASVVTDFRRTNNTLLSVGQSGVVREHAKSKVIQWEVL